MLTNLESDKVRGEEEELGWNHDELIDAYCTSFRNLMIQRTNRVMLPKFCIQFNHLTDEYSYKMPSYVQEVGAKMQV